MCHHRSPWATHNDEGQQVHVGHPGTTKLPVPDGLDVGFGRRLHRLALLASELKDNLHRRSHSDIEAERDRLGFVRQPMVRWLDPAILAKSAIEVVVSSTFGRFADKRELQTEPQPLYDYSRRRELWMDFLSDTGDGFDSTYTMAWLLAQPQLDVLDADDALPRADVLLLGGDQVYPTADVEAYEDRFLGPFRAALPRVEDESAPELYAVPGNHDWYDGLTSFLRIFCQRGWVGGWRKRQRRSYFALKLPHRWWLWAIDIQLDTYLDERQLAYFEAVADRLTAGDHVVLITAKPSWVNARPGKLDPPSWRYLAFFEQRMIREKGAILVLTLTGDRHHYSRYEPLHPDSGQPTRITAGGGGAYLSPTHTLPSDIELKPGMGEETVPYSRNHEIYPSEEQSRHLRRGVFRLSSTNPGFAVLMGAVYSVLAAATLGSLNLGQRALVEEGAQGGFIDYLASAASGTTILLALLLVAALATYADAGPWPAKLGVGGAHALVHVAAVEGVVYAVTVAFSPGTLGVFVWLVVLPLTFAAGYLGGTLIFASVLFAIHVLRGPHAENHANEVFASQAITGYKNFLRLHLDAGGLLNVYAVGVDESCDQWEHAGRDGPEPQFYPRAEAPEGRIIDGPLVFEPPAG